MFDEFIGENVVIDLRSSYVCLGTLQRVSDQYLELKNADLHDLRDSTSTRETYVAASRMTGIKRNRKRLLLICTEIVGISLLKDVVDE